MKIIHVGAFEYYIFDEVVSDTMEELGHEVIRFPVYKYIKGFLGKVERHLSWVGPLSIYMNFRLYQKIRAEKPDVLFAWRVTTLHPFLLKKIKRNFKTKMVSFNNDDPFSPYYKTGNIYQKALWRNFKKTIPLFDINAVFRPHNIFDYDQAGSQKSILFPPYYTPQLINNENDLVRKYDVLFIGLYTVERAEMLNYLIEHGINVKIFGTDWKPSYLSQKYKYDKKIEAIRGEAYYEAIKSSKICLAFLSKFNRDKYTYRSFEIPASGTLMLSERTDELCKHFAEDKEVVYFSSNEELLEKIRNLLANPDKRKMISIEGKQRSYNSGYDVKSRVANFLEQIK